MEKEPSEKMETTQKEAGKKGGLRTMPFIMANEIFEKISSFGLHTNMIFYLTNEYHLDSAKGAIVLFLWSALTNFLPIVGAFLSDSYLGRFKVIAMGTLVTLLGMVVLWLTAIFPKARPPHCKSPGEFCVSANFAQLMLLYFAFLLMSIGAGGIRPCSLAFGADQLEKPGNPKNERTMQSFFNWYYATVGVSVTVSVLFMVYLQNAAGWVVGYGVPVGLMMFSTVMFFLGSSLYVKLMANKSLLRSLAQVIVAAWKNRHLELPPQTSDKWFYHKGSKLVNPTPKLRFLNKACMIRNKETDVDSNGMAKFPWRLTTIQRVEELKAVIRVLPIWSTGIVISATISQYTFSALQAITMDRQITPHFQFPAASFAVFTILTLTFWVAIYDQIIVRLLAKFTKRSNGLTFKQRMGIGLAISCLASAVSAEIERKRRNRAFHEGLANVPGGIVKMSAMWLVPQHCLAGLAEAFHAIGQIQFFYSQLPRSMASIAVALFSLGMGGGSLLAALIVSVVKKKTTKNGNAGWLSNNPNQGHYDYYYWVLALMGVANLFYYLICSWLYGDEKEIMEESRIWDDDKEAIEEDGTYDA
ncbi:Protein NRT1/ PTR FAMILY 1.2, partial [Cucurbita argyrosperma subsp. argyrosperma]